MAKEELTPMMRQFRDLKAKHPDAILLFRCGDFYETYLDDAVTASQVLGITLTRRNNGKSSSPTEMAGFPHHASTPICRASSVLDTAWPFATSWKTPSSPRNS